MIAHALCRPCPSLSSRLSSTFSLCVARNTGACIRTRRPCTEHAIAHPRCSTSRSRRARRRGAKTKRATATASRCSGARTRCWVSESVSRPSMQLWSGEAEALGRATDAWCRRISRARRCSTVTRAGRRPSAKGCRAPRSSAAGLCCTGCACRAHPSADSGVPVISLRGGCGACSACRPPRTKSSKPHPTKSPRLCIAVACSSTNARAECKDCCAGLKSFRPLRTGGPRPCSHIQRMGRREHKPSANARASSRKACRPKARCGRVCATAWVLALAWSFKTAGAAAGG